MRIHPAWRLVVCSWVCLQASAAVAQDCACDAACPTEVCVAPAVAPPLEDEPGARPDAFVVEWDDIGWHSGTAGDGIEGGLSRDVADSTSRAAARNAASATCQGEVRIRGAHYEPECIERSAGNHRCTFSAHFDCRRRKPNPALDDWRRRKQIYDAYAREVRDAEEAHNACQRRQQEAQRCRQRCLQRCRGTSTTPAGSPHTSSSTNRTPSMPPPSPTGGPSPGAGAASSSAHGASSLASSSTTTDIGGGTGVPDPSTASNTGEAIGMGVGSLLGVAFAGIGGTAGVMGAVEMGAGFVVGILPIVSLGLALVASAGLGMLTYIAAAAVLQVTFFRGHTDVFPLSGVHNDQDAMDTMFVVAGATALVGVLAGASLVVTVLSSDDVDFADVPQAVLQLPLTLATSGMPSWLLPMMFAGAAAAVLYPVMGVTSAVGYVYGWATGAPSATLLASSSTSALPPRSVFVALQE